MESTPISMESHQDDLSRCLVDLHGTCLVLPFHREGLPYLALIFVAFYQFTYILKRMLARELNMPYNPSSMPEWHLLVGRMALMMVALTSLIDNLRIFVGSFDMSWPFYIANAPNATIATEQWAHHGYGGANMQTFFFWYCSFLKTIMSPALIYSVTSIYYKAAHRSWRIISQSGNHDYFWIETLVPANADNWFLCSTVLVLLIFVPSLIGFFLGPIRSPLKVIQISSGVGSLWSVTNTVTSPVGQLGVIMWYLSLLVLAILFYRWIEGPEKRVMNGLFSFLVLLAGITTVAGSSPIVLNWTLQVTLACQIWADVTHNPDDYGRLNDDLFLQEARQPLLPRTSNRDGEDDEESEEESEYSAEEQDEEDVRG